MLGSYKLSTAVPGDNTSKRQYPSQQLEETGHAKDVPEVVGPHVVALCPRGQQDDALLRVVPEVPRHPGVRQAARQLALPTLYRHLRRRGTPT